MNTGAGKPVHIDDLHGEHMLWMDQLLFCRDEIAIFEHRAREIVQRNTGEEVMAELEQFQNRFIRQREVIDQLLHDLKLHENALAVEAQDHPIAVEHRLFHDHVTDRSAMAVFERLYRELKDAFMQWLVKRM